MLVPLVAALAALAVVLVVMQVRSTDRGSPGSPGPTPAQPVPVSPMPGDHRDPLVVPVTSYTAHGPTLRLYYTTGVPSCYGRLGPPAVLETARDVTVTLRRVPPGRRAQVCPDLALLSSVDVTLGSPLGDRLVRDGGRGGARVPQGRPLGYGVTPAR